MRISSKLLLLTLGLALAGTASAGTLPGKGPNPNWTEMQKLEWYLGYMSSATAICRFYGKSADLRSLASLTPYGRVGLSGIGGDGFYGAACQRIGEEADELLADAAALKRYFAGTYDCEVGGKCGIESDAKLPDHACSGAIENVLADFEVQRADIEKVYITQRPQGTAAMANNPFYQARVRLNACQGSLNIDLGERCTVERAYTRDAGSCTDGPVTPQADHACAAAVGHALESLEIKDSDIASVTVSSLPPGPASGGAAPHQALVRLHGCRGSLYIDLGESCRVTQTYTRGVGQCSEQTVSLSSDHTCTPKVEAFLKELEVTNAEIKSAEIRTLSEYNGGSRTAHVYHRAQVGLMSCRGTLYLDLDKRCSVRESYTRGDCEIAGVSGY